MGVHSLWDIVGPSARPVKLEALSRKRLAVDASIWIYQFMKAVRDKEGNSLGQTHIVGFFRRICKMLYFGMLPLFVFDGGAPPLKRQVIQARKERRQGNQENATNTAQKLLAMQMHRNAGSGRNGANNGNKSKPQKVNSGTEDNETLYFDDLPMHHSEHHVAPPKPIENTPQTFRRKDEYHLPELKQFTVRKDDLRIMPEGELEDYGEEHSWDFVDGINIDSVDPSSADFAELPMATQYMILSHLRLRSRLRLGYSKDQLEDLFPNSRDFSKFQIQQVQKRNYYTQKLMTVSGMGEETGNVTRRIAGDKDRQYMLVKNDGGWTLSLGGTNKEEPIELDEDGEVEPKTEFTAKNENVSDSSDDDLLEDVPLETEEFNEKPVPPSFKVEDDSDDEAVNKAVIESIYDQYKHEYDETKQNDQAIQQKIESYRDTDLEKAIEESKKDYYQQRNKELESTKGVTHNSVPDFEFGKSLLFGNLEEPRNDVPTKNKYTEEQVVELPKNEIIDLNLPESQNKSENESERESEEKKGNNLPLWFNDSSHLQSPHASIGFLSDRQEIRAIDENEEAGLIPWNEAKQYFEENAETETIDDDIQIVDEKDDSDLEIIAEVKETQPSNHPSGTGLNTDKNDNKALNNDSISHEDEIYPPQKPNHKRVEPRKYFVKEGRNSKKTTNASVPLTPSILSRLPTKIHLKTQELESAESPETSTHNNGLNVETSGPQPRKNGKNAQILDYGFDESEEEDLAKLLREEEQEHSHFTSRIQLDQVPIHTKVSNEQLLQEQLQKAKRDAEEVTQTMINDVQELLKRFGIPHITAPMEAEAQCAELYMLGLVDGIVTDDSDCFLFGGSRIYKNMFNQKQYVECYIAEDIEHTVGLNQKKLIELALLLGSDYTEGIKGIGPVLAMEILAEFGSLDKLKQWFDETTKTLKKPDTKNMSKLQKTLLTRIKNGKLFLPDNFPDLVVVDAYKRPEVDKDKSEFKWGVPLLDQIRSFLMYNVGWSQERVDEVMVPLIRNINKVRTEGQQTTISEFFPQEYISYRKDVGMGKRMKAAANRIRGE